MQNLLLNRYEIVSPLGSGGFGETFLARDTQIPSQRLVVLKRLKPATQSHHTSTEMIEKLFGKEAEVLEELGSHCSQIPTLLSYFADQGQFYLVQEYIEGKSLAQVGIISSEQAVAILTSLLNTLKYIHSKNIIHRDIKPENIILRDSDRLPVLIDFGAVKETMGAVTLGSGSTISSVIVGTRGFMAPEQSAGRTVFSTDLYALGLTMIYTLTGKLPIEFDTSQLTGELDWHSHVPNLEPKLAKVLDKSIKLDLSSRYRTAAEMYQDLHLVENNTSILPPSHLNTVIISPKSDTLPQTLINTEVESKQIPTEKTAKFSNLKLRMIIITVVLTALGLGGGFFVTREILEAQQNAAQAQQEKQEAEQKRLEAEQRAAQAEREKQEAEQKRLEAEKQQAQEQRQRLAAEARQAREERQRLAAERKRLESLASTYVASVNTATSNTTIRNSNSSLTRRSTCGHPYVSGADWWAVKGPSSALSTVKNNYCGDALIVGKETQAASFTSEMDARSFANSLSNESGYQFWVTKSR
ncbi:protein kinase [Anabaenopsis sp. FSS-46]|uniref:protein kinase domain-containing protein n=1 Tax=Anabaenopsis sp. FSS-46 TaxID=2971766 RepID=UPI0024755AF9|nr:protein kinase [Anabaenopsis sp. FSS-46]MDH6100610.1 protein kinase [Anabaenopsis sp. FSS-46]